MAFQLRVAIVILLSAATTTTSRAEPPTTSTAPPSPAPLTSPTKEAVRPMPAGAFVEAGDEKGVRFQEQRLQGTDFLNLRASIEVDAPAEVVLETMWGKGTKEEASASVTSRELLVNEPLRRVYYETAAAPLISTRDYVLEVKKTVEPEKGLYALRFRSIAWPARPPHQDRVRITIVGDTAIVPSADKRSCRVTQTIYSNPGGSIPAWVAKGNQRATVADGLTRVKARAEQRATKH